MPNDPHRPRRPAHRGPRASPDARHSTHLELVTEGWIAELAWVVVLAAPAEHAAAARRSTVLRTMGREPRSGSSPSSPA
jgi:hypothetical protein